MEPITTNTSPFVNIHRMGEEGRNSIKGKEFNCIVTVLCQQNTPTWKAESKSHEDFD
jgi:hypothetical protein